MTNPELTPPPDEFKNFKNCLDGVYNHTFFTGKHANARKAVFVAMIAYTLEQGMNELIDNFNFNPIKLVKKIAERTGLEIPKVLAEKIETDEWDGEWDDDWNKQLVDFDLAVQRELKVYNKVVSFYRFNSNSN